MTKRNQSQAPCFSLLIVGDEILSGKRQDQHFVKVRGLLNVRGLGLSSTHYLPDDRSALTEFLAASFERARNPKQDQHVLISCGGIGATSDDHTRQAAAAALGVPLVLHPEAQRLITQRCAQMAQAGKGSADMSIPENQQRLKMGEFPKGAGLIANPYNQIPGFSMYHHWFLPGFPIMAWPMIESILDTQYAAWFHSHDRSERALWVFDLAEAVVAPLMEQIEAQFPGIKAFSLPCVGQGHEGQYARAHIELGVKGTEPQLTQAFDVLLSGVRKMAAEYALEAPAA